LIDALSALLVEETVTLVGWSLGGHLATLYAAMHPQQVQGVLTMASNPCFVQKNDWPDAMPKKVFSGFLEGINNASVQTLKHFVMLCSQGGAQQRETVRFIRKIVADSSPDFNQLAQLLALLGSSDTRL
jgi:pimeloyl-[acyl-carrier protein] methyl ester esterase